jgi:5-methylcytosine-specific restriction endonuclease McrA
MFPVVKDVSKKPTRAERKAKKKGDERKRALTRAQLRAIVMRRERERCERCKVKVSYDVHPADDTRAQVNERVPKSLGGNPLDPDNCELTCRKCHFGGPSGAHAPTKARMKRRCDASA